MWTRTATLADLSYCLRADALAGVSLDRTKYLQTVLVDGGCFVGGRSQEAEGILISAETFFSRPFVSLLFIEEPARRQGLASGLMTAAEAKYPGRQLFTSTNQSNLPMQTLLQRRGYLPAGVILHLDPGDAELIFMKQL
jgi:GNAT superfamily N-acetyltransferase